MSINLSSSTIPVGHSDQSTSKRKIDRSSDSLPSNSDNGSEKTYNTSLVHCMLAGGFGGMVGDSLMHSLDTVKTRQQGASHISKYSSTIPAYLTILKEEGFRKGLYSGYSAAMLGSFPSAAIFFLTYETTKRIFIDEFGFNETLTYLGGGFLGDFVSSIFYVPSEVLKTRLQLQGRYNNPHFDSGYNYTSLFDAINKIIRQEGWQALFFGYKATLVRDLPFSALQFAFYEEFRRWAFDLSKKNSEKENLNVLSELVTGAAAGGLAGIITTPLDVIKTRMQTQNTSANTGQILTSNSILKSLNFVYRSQGLVGLFSGVGPRFVWTSIQSSVMLLLYQVTLKTLETGEISFDGLA
ncbi:unnamed protein product [[Candida] boidinii]|nr:unnamed protein product [[Candida] boidinii]